VIAKQQAEGTSGRGLPAVSIRQPQASALVDCPGPFEHPAWETEYRGQLLIHAAKRGAGDPPVGRSDSPAYGALVGVVDLVDCIRTERDGGGPDEVGFVWVLTNARSFSVPVPYVGRLGLFDVPHAVVAGALERLERLTARNLAKRSRPALAGKHAPRPTAVKQPRRQKAGG
jgi:hypothetical protein